LHIHTNDLLLVIFCHTNDLLLEFFYHTNDLLLVSFGRIGLIYDLVEEVEAKDAAGLKEDEVA